MIKKVISRYLHSKIFRPIGSLRNLIFRLRFFPGNGLRSETGVLHWETRHIGDVELMFIKKVVKSRIGSLDPSQTVVIGRHVGGKQLISVISP